MLGPVSGKSSRHLRRWLRHQPGRMRPEHLRPGDECPRRRHQCRPRGGDSPEPVPAPPPGAAKTAARTSAPGLQARMTKAEVANIIREKAKDLGKDVPRVRFKPTPKPHTGRNHRRVRSVDLGRPRSHRHRQRRRRLCQARLLGAGHPRRRKRPLQPRGPLARRAVLPRPQSAPAPPQQLSASIGPARQPPPVAGPAYAWVSARWRRSETPSWAVRRRAACSRFAAAPMKEASPGKIVAGKCNFGYAGNEISVARFDVLTGDGARLEWAASPSARTW